MTDISSALNYLLATQFSDVTRGQVTVLPKPKENVRASQQLPAIIIVNNQLEGQRRQPDQRPQSFANIMRPKVTLPPSDELELFAEDTWEEAPLLMAQDEQGVEVEGTVITPQGEEIGGKVLNMAERLQQAVSGLYLRNSLAVYYEQPAVQFAA